MPHPRMSLAATEDSPKKKILFVDDDRPLLDGLRDAFRSYRREWTMNFVESSEAAIAVIEAEPQDAIVCDLRMPGTDGAVLLSIVKERWPETIRMVLSGHAEMTLVARAATVAHRIIAKPCDARELGRFIAQACSIQELLRQVELSRRALGASDLPSVPYVYAELTRVLASGSAGAPDAARVIERDIALSAKVLQLANSAYFGRRTPVGSLSGAVAYLGVDLLRAMVLQAEAFRAFEVTPPIRGFDVEDLHRHSLHVARLTALVIGERSGRDEAFTAGLLHDVGLLVLASQSRNDLDAVLREARDFRRHVFQVEIERFGATHAEFGAHLLSLWGLPATITEPVARHHTGALHNSPWPTVDALYLANGLIEEIEAASRPDAPPPLELDLEYLETSGYARQLDHWREEAVRVTEE
jgi:HD-like signal output (HDOD) protein